MRETNIRTLAFKAERLQHDYMHGFLVKDTQAWEDFCFANSALIVKALKIAAEAKGAGFEPSEGK